MKNLTICVDVDGTINDYSATVAPLVYKDFNISVDPTQYNMFAGLSQSEVNAFHQRHAAELLDTPIMPGAANVIRYLRAVSHRVVVVTARPYAMAEDTLTWLKRNEVGYDDVLFNCDDKSAACKFVKTDVMVDDAPHNLENLVAGGVNVVVFDRPYNVNFDLPRLTEWTVNDTVNAVNAAMCRSTTSTR